MPGIKNIIYLNIDIAIGACINCYFFATVYDVPVTFVVYILLFNAVWAIYTLDRIFDSNFGNYPKTQRHIFHKRNKPVLLVFILLSVLVNIWLVFKIEAVLIFYGLILAAGAGGYLIFTLLFKGRFVKEPWVALFYSLGVSLAPLSLKFGWVVEDFLVLVIHFLIAFLNLSVFSFYEWEIDKKSAQYSMLAGKSERFCNYWFVILTLLIFSLSFSLSFFNKELIPVSFIFFLMGGVLLFIYYHKPLFAQKGRYRLWADSVFMLPLLIAMVQS